MKHLFSYIVLCFAVFNTGVVSAETAYPLPDDFEGQETRQILQARQNMDPEDLEDEPMSVAEQMAITYEAATYLYKKYTPQEIAKKSFIKKIRPFFPDYTQEQLESRHKLFAYGTGIYNYGKQKYTEFINKYLVPFTHRKVRNDNEYDHPDEIPYKEVAEGEYVKVYNFKKFLTYSDNPDERAAIAEYEANKNKESLFEQFNDALQKIEWKKVALYGIEYDNPLYSTNGITPVQQTLAGSIRLATDGAFINNRQELKIGIFAAVKPEMFVLANNLNFHLQKPHINLDKSQNIAPDYQILYPVPIRSQLYPEIYKYTGNYIILIDIRPIDPEKPVIIRAETDITECDYHLNCAPQHFYFEQKLEAHGTHPFGNGMENYFFRAQAAMPQADLKNLRLKEFTAHRDASGQSLFLEFETNKSVNTFNVYIEENDAYTTFKEPQISLRDKKIFVRIDPSDEYVSRDLSNAEYTISANLNNKEFLRQILVPQPSHGTNIPSANFGFMFFFSALISGIFLNFIPCVFPLWAHKLLSMFTLHKQPTAVIHIHLKQILIGILCTAVFAFALLLAGKTRMEPYVWGSQLQNLPYILTILFTGLLLIKILPHISQNIAEKHTSFLNYAFGALGMILALSGTAPYLSATLTAAANHGYTILCLAFMTVLCGFCLPFALLLKLNNPQMFLINIHRYREPLDILMKIMLYLAYFWYILLIYWQTGLVWTVKIFLITLVFLFIADICLKFLQYLDDVHEENITLPYLNKMRTGSYVFIMLITLGFIIPSSISATHRQTKNLRQNVQNISSATAFKDILSEISQGNAVLVSVETDWCLACRINNGVVFNQSNLIKWNQQYRLKHIRINQTGFTPDLTDYIQQYLGKVDIPFYVLYTPIIRNGIVLPTMPSIESIDRLLIYNKQTSSKKIKTLLSQ